METTLPLSGHRQGKVRDIYEAVLADGTEAVVLIASDRISAFDVVMPNGVPGKGVVLTQISRFWFDMIERQLGDRIRHHIISYDPAILPGLSDKQIAQMRGRTMVAHKTSVVPIECVVRGYLTGSAWKEYQAGGTMHGAPLPPGLREAEQLPEPVFTPATKAPDGLHDENISFDDAADLVGGDLAAACRDLSLALYRAGADHAAGQGIIVADTKFELGVVDGRLVVADEMLTPDSSRFWSAEQWAPGSTPPSFDKQPVRDHLDALAWDKTPPPPPLPPEVIAATTQRYTEAYERISGLRLADWPGAST